MFNYNKIIILSILFIKSAAQGGAWSLPKNVSELNVDYEYKFVYSYFFDRTQQQNYLSKVDQFELFNLHYQYGITNKYTLVIEEKWFNYRGSAQVYSGEDHNYEFHQLTDDMYDSHYQKFENNPYQTKLSLQREIFKRSNFVFSLKPGLELYNNKIDKAVELGFLFGVNFDINHKHHYINCEYYLSKNTKELKNSNYDNFTRYLELTYSMGITRKQSILLQLLNQRNEGIFRDQDLTQAKIAWHYDTKAGIGVKVGYLTNISRRKNYIIESFSAGVIIRF